MATCFLEKNYDRDYLVSKIVQDPSSAKMTTKPVTEGFAVVCTMEVFFCRHCHNDPDSKSCLPVGPEYTTDTRTSSVQTESVFRTLYPTDRKNIDEPWMGF